MEVSQLYGCRSDDGNRSVETVSTHTNVYMMIPWKLLGLSTEVYESKGVLYNLKS